jgi:hypothetical protein
MRMPCAMPWPLALAYTPLSGALLLYALPLFKDSKSHSWSCADEAEPICVSCLCVSEAATLSETQDDDMYYSMFF